MSIVKELNELAEKITGENPKKATASDALDFIADYLKGENSNELSISKNIKIIADNYSGGGADLSEYFTNEFPSKFPTDTLKKFPNNMQLNENVTELSNAFLDYINLIEAPFFDTSNVTGFNLMFRNCSNLVSVPVYDTSKVNNIMQLQSMFSNCPKLSDDSLNNILQMCINTQLTGEYLVDLGLNDEQLEKCATLSNYQAFLDAGWKLWSD